MKKLLSVLLPIFLLGCNDCNGDIPVPTPELTATTSQSDTLTICSFNIQFVGHFTKKDDTSPAAFLKDYDIVVVQEHLQLLQELNGPK